MDEKDQAEQQQQADEFGDAFAELAANLTPPGGAAPAQQTPEEKAAAEKATADKAAADAAAAAQTPEQKAAAEKAAADAAAAAAAQTPEQKAAAEKAAVDAAAAAAAQTPEQKAAAEKAAVDAAAAAAAAPAPDVAKRLEEANRRIAELEASTRAAPAAAAAAPAAAAAAPPALYTPEEEKILKDYEEEWGKVSAGEALKRRAEYHALVKHIFEQVEQRYSHVLDYVDVRSTKDQYSEIKALVPDYDEVRDSCLAWVEKQPEGVKAAYQQVVKEGSPQDVAALITTFKTMTGKAAAAPAPAAAAPAAAAAGMAAAPAAAAAAADPAKSAAVVALRPVDTKRSDAGGGPDPNDFGSAFAEFAGTSAR